MPRAGYGDLEVGSETSAPQAVHPVGSASAPGIAFSTDTDLGLYRAAANQLGISAGAVGQAVVSSGALTFLLSTNISASSGTLTVTSPTIVTPTIAATGWTNANHTHAGGTTGGTLGASSEVTVTATTASETVYLTYVDGTSSSQAIEVDTDLQYNPGTGEMIVPGEIDAASLDISGNVDIDGTLEADAITVEGASLASVIAGTTVTTATNATNITVADTTDSTCFVGLWESVTGNQPPKSDTGLTYNASTGTLTATAISSDSVKSVGFILAMS